MEQVQQVTEEELVTVLAGVLDRPLYTPFKYQGADNVNALPSRVKHYCPICDKELNWDRTNGGKWVTAPNDNTPPGSGAPRGSYQWKDVDLTDVEYKCKNCEKSTVVAYIRWWSSERTLQEMKEDLAAMKAGLPRPVRPTTSVFMKVGQYPPILERIAPELKKELDDEENRFYSTALRCRNFSMGIAAVSYMRRVVERKMYSLLDLIIELDKSLGQETPLAADIEAIKQKRPSEVLDFAGKILPNSLKPAGRNPLDGLYGVFSDGLHNRPESECIVIFDKAKASFEYLFERLRSELDRAAAYLKASEEVEQLKNKAKDSKAVSRGPS